MERRTFITKSVISATVLLSSGSLVSFFSSCSKNDLMTNSNNTTKIVENLFTKTLPIPASASAVTTLNAQVTTSTIVDTPITVLGYQLGNILGPTFRVKNGETVSVTLNNLLSDINNIHWHGLIIPSNMDGYPTDIAVPGGIKRYQFNINQRAGLYWYHPHSDALTASQAYKGLAGLFIINDNEELLLNLPSGTNEIPLVIQDKRLGSNGLNYNPTMMDTMSGFMGESIIVNGVNSPNLNVSTRIYRLRILNGSNARIYNLAFDNNLSFYIIGSDGGLLQSPISVNEILLAPAERLDILVDFSKVKINTELYLMSKQFSNAGNSQGGQSFKIMKFSVNQSFNESYIIPSSLSNYQQLPTPTNSRSFILSEMTMGSGMGARMTGMHKINGKIFDANRIDEYVNANSIESWSFENQGTEPHPIHLHGVQFRITERSGGSNRGVIASEMGWKDTVLLLPGEKVKILIPFGSNTGKFVFHCHNLEHEDDGMMLQFQIN